ncbi:class I SAM-dependent methyltransferase [Phytoactinopolyspora mesophila]|uniref:Methyltransferase domain-containing protein n=1 Tax=Phytoactinopolyspora mesophila TaxID=2650750 RepID=A0A7K3M4E3_9ACTN|nr:class I SAM-dependent methyltransferase [Phytoactinopolyspora mesophila]NDL57907.1 methyltransferase domain-containing protein [Phytoactinopolyspora mesophila]
MTPPTHSGLDATEAAQLQTSWETQQEPFLPHRAEAFEVLVQVAAEVAGGRGRPLRVLELAAGTGSITLRLLQTLAEVDATVLEIDPVLLAIAGASIGDRAQIVEADLSDPGWPAKLPHQGFDVVLSGNALHCFSAERLADLYRQVRGVVGPGGAFALAEQMPRKPEPGSGAPDESASPEAVRAAVDAWDTWWVDVLSRPSLSAAAERRRHLQLCSADFYPDPAWHHDALTAAGFAGTGIGWSKADTVVLVAT